MAFTEPGLTASTGALTMRQLVRWAAIAVAGWTILTAGCKVEKSSPARSQGLPAPDPGFQGVISPEAAKAKPAWPQEVKPGKDAPNVVLILVDDVGFSATATFGGVIQTPSFDKLTASGLRYNNFHVNSLCSPSRATLLTGRNNHQVGFGTVAEAATGFPGYNSLWPKSTASIAEVLKDNGYSTAAFGKWHNTPTWQVSPAGPFDRWPTGLGFQHFYGFLAGYDNQYYPRLFRDTVPVEPPSTPKQGYNLTADMTDEAIRWLHQQEAVAPDKPFFLYYAPGATHTPHQVSASWIKKYQGKFDAGWDQIREETFKRQKQLGVIPANAELTPRPAGLPAWSSLPPDEQKLLAHQAEVYAAFTEQTDYQIGRLLQEIDNTGKGNNTLVIEIFGDNGASAEGGSDGYDARDVQGTPLTIQQRLALSNGDGSELYMNHFAAAWAWALSSPFQGTKMDSAHLGGTTDPMVVSWPARIQHGGGLRTQFQHLNDIAPTIYAAAGVQAPDLVNGTQQLPIEGSSFLYTFDHPEEPSHHHVQYFAMVGNLGIYKDGWWAGRHFWSPWEKGSPWASGDVSPDQHPWELYNLNEDYSQAHDLAAKFPEKLKELQQLFDQEAAHNQAYPLFQTGGNQPPHNSGLVVYRDGVDRLPNAVAPHIVGRKHTITADIEVPAQGSDGVIIAQGSRYGGFTLFVKDKHVIYEVNAFGNRGGQLVSQGTLKPGKAHIVLEVEPDAGPSAKATLLSQPGPRPGSASLSINGVDEGKAAFVNLNGSSYTETLDVGSDLGSPVSPAYQVPDKFKGKIDEITIQFR
jgi:arylsulfatase A-like enzyme